MPYKQGKYVDGQDPRSFSMYIFVPSETNTGLLGNWSDSYGKKNLLQFIEEMKVNGKVFEKQIKEQKEEISKILIPKFDLESNVMLSSTMDQLGLTFPFKAGKMELMKFLNSPVSELLYVADITQKSRIETSKGGTSLSVVTYTTLCGPSHRCSPVLPSKMNFVDENPFMFKIQEDFSGAVISASTMLSTSLSSQKS
ncbi:serpin-ZX isoform X2 [Spinacia oleracea]|uniref:Serpin-ZX-like n=1 Tax=Spinacia oleracea TaxID=3562 RepID=A0A9R0J7W0_SPIOL|nr:serpin-ZX-like isoform X2 [Spinacia oleracea]XP_021862517.1 serpin-ZX-like isoform X2 [Spinacia oleracea]